ncbi:hypothetical protein AB0C69_28115, partial [Actinomadura sp. NPDC048032]|uniref:hypothetical protein n=1 Tax=Actinomadura sp. NPDC048032 TaxID=3155747 RepID=UPI0033EE1EC1
MSGGRRVALVGGHESRQGRCLPDLAGSGGPRVHAAGRDLHSALRPGDRLVAVPMTLGRDPDLPVVTAQTLRWAARERAPGDLLLAGPLARRRCHGAPGGAGRVRRRRVPVAAVLPRPGG